MKIAFSGLLYSLSRRIVLSSSIYSPFATLSYHSLDSVAFNRPIHKYYLTNNNKKLCNSFKTLTNTIPFQSTKSRNTRIRIMSQNIHMNDPNQDKERLRIINAAREQKKKLRKKIRNLLKAMPDEQIQIQSQKVWNRLYSLSEYKNAKSIGLFLSMPSNEINTDSVVRQVLRDGKGLFIPRVGLDFEKCDMDLIRVPDIAVKNDSTESIFHDDWPRNKWGIPEPPNDEGEHIAGPGDIDLLIVPGVAFDKNGGRLGQGKGYYDRFIDRVRLENKDGSEEVKTKKIYSPTLVAVGMEPQFLDDELVPVLEHDFQMDIVLTPNLSHTL